MQPLQRRYALTDMKDLHRMNTAPKQTKVVTVDALNDAAAGTPFAEPKSAEAQERSVGRGRRKRFIGGA